MKIQKSPDCVLFWIEFFIQNVVLGVSRRKNFKMFPCGVSFSCAFVEIFIKVPYYNNPPPPSSLLAFLSWKISGCARALMHYSFCNPPLKRLAVFWIRLFLDNCSVICTVNLCYVLHQTHSEFWIFSTQVSQVYSGIFHHIQHIDTLLRHIKFIQPYSACCVTLAYS